MRRSICTLAQICWIIGRCSHQLLHREENIVVSDFIRISSLTSFRYFHEQTGLRSCLIVMETNTWIHLFFVSILERIWQSSDSARRSDRSPTLCSDEFWVCSYFVHQWKTRLYLTVSFSIKVNIKSDAITSDRTSFTLASDEIPVSLVNRWWRRRHIPQYESSLKDVCRSSTTSQLVSAQIYSIESSEFSRLFICTEVSPRHG